MQEVIRVRIHWSETNLAMRSKLLWQWEILDLSLPLIKTNNWSAETNLNNTRHLIELHIWVRDTVMRHWSADTRFWQLSVHHNMDVH